jgi:hypothetical protein
MFQNLLKSRLLQADHLIFFEILRWGISYFRLKYKMANTLSEGF